MSARRAECDATNPSRHCLQLTKETRKAALTKAARKAGTHEGNQEGT